MRRCTFTLCQTEVELVLTRDPGTQQWLAVTRWHLEDSPGPVSYPMQPQAPSISESEAWEAAKQWASQRLGQDWLRIAAQNADSSLVEQ